MNFVIGPGMPAHRTTGGFMRANSIALAILLAACSSRPLSRVPFDANAEAISQLNGRWVGDYSSAGTGHSGTIVFDLSGDQKTARGDVVMYSSIVNVPADIHHAADVLSISFVRATDDVVTGKTLTTTFTG